MNLVEENEKGQITTGLKRGPLKHIKQIADTTCVWPSPAGPAGYRSLNFLSLVNLIIRVRVLLLVEKARYLRGKPKCLNCFRRIFRDVLTQIYVFSDSYTKLCLLTEHLPSLVVYGIVEVNLFVMLMPSHSHRVAFGHIEFHLPVALQDTVVCEQANRRTYVAPQFVFKDEKENGS